MKSKVWLIGWGCITMTILAIIGGWVYKVDPYFHYHKPDTESYFYTLDNQRSQNNGITKHFDYDALITGTSMTENFKTTEANAIFGVKSIKVPFSGSTFKEVNDNLEVALENNPDLKLIIRGLDLAKFIDDKDSIREDLGEYPTYLYDDNPFNDVRYLYSKDIIFNRVYRMTSENDELDFSPGITSFDNYSNWNRNYTFGVNSVCPEGISMEKSSEEIHLTADEKMILEGNIVQNVTSLARKYPDVDFYYFLTPYSIVWWNERVNDGTIYKQIEAEKYVVELILECENIKLYSFNNRTDITTNLNNYKDSSHYGEWINSMMLKWMYEGECRLTRDNYLDYLEKEYEFYTGYNYESILNQVDYEKDSYAVALLREEFSGVAPLDMMQSDSVRIELHGAEIKEGDADMWREIKCEGILERTTSDEMSVEEYLLKEEYIGAKFLVDSVMQYKYLVFYGKKCAGHGQPTVCMYDSEGQLLRAIKEEYSDIDNEWHQYIIELPNVEGEVTFLFNGGYVDNAGDVDSSYIFRDIVMY